jgi:hypothetical protein
MKEKLKLKVEDIALISELSPSNQYESQILSSLKNLSGKRMCKFQLPETTEKDFAFLRTDLRGSKDRLAVGQSGIFKGIKDAELQRKAEFECDLYFKADSLVTSTEEFLESAVLDLHKKTDIKEPEFTGTEWIFVEITQGPQFLLQKLWQLERALYILSYFNTPIIPSSLVVLLNGDQKEARDAIDLIKIPGDSLISRYPLYIGWTPTRNIFKSLKNLQDDMTGVKADINGLKADMTGVKADIKGLKADMTGVKADINGLKADMTGVKDNLSNLTNSVASLESLIRQLLDKK